MPCFIHSSLAQVTNRTYYDLRWKPVKKQQDAAFYRDWYQDHDTVRVKEYEVGGRLILEGSYKDKTFKTRVGKFTVYEKDRKVSEGSYADGKKNGYWSNWRSSGVLMSTGAFADDKRDGAWTYYYENGKVQAEVSYTKGVTVAVKEYHTDGHMLNEEDTFLFPLEQAVFNPDHGEVYQFLARNIQYPKEARENGIEGKVVLQFVVNREGSVSNVEIIRSDHYFDQECLRVVKSMPAWKPGKNNGKPVCTIVTLPVQFRLN